MPSLGNDLARIRKEQNLSLDDIQRATKIPKHILNSIEDDSIFSDFDENPTYTRSYVRSYAKAISIDEQQIVHALNKKQKNDYEGSLQQLLDQPPRQTFQLDEDVSDAETDTDNKEETTSGRMEETADIEKQDEPLASSAGTSASKPESPDVRSVDWADMGRRFQPLESTKSKMWIGIVVLFIIGASAVYFYFYKSDLGDSPNDSTLSEQPKQETPTETKTSSDSLQLNLIPPAENDTSNLSEETDDQQTQETINTLPDTLNMVVYAAYDKLEPVRVYTDITDGINPYWIEQGDAVRFQFINEIRIRGQFSRMELLFNGHTIPDFGEKFYNSDTRLLEIERSFFEGDSTWLQPPPDSLNIDAPPPTNIQNRSSLIDVSTTTNG